VLERVDVVAVASSAPAHVPWSNVDALLGPYARWLDEWTVHVPAIAPAVWDEVVARAEQLEAPPGDAPSHLTQNTWWSTQVTDAPTEVFPPPKPREAQTPEDPGVRRWWDIWRERR
jgi:hypothetical protein